MFADTPSSRRQAAPDRGRARAWEPRPGGDRGRLLRAAERIVSEQGASALTVESVCAVTGISRRLFGLSFVDRTELLVALYGELAHRARTAMGDAYLAEEAWLDGVRSALTALLVMLDRNIPLARFVLVDSAIEEGVLPLYRAASIVEAGEALDRDRPAAESKSASLPFDAETTVGAIVAILHGRVLEEPAPPLAELCGPLMGMIALPYLGSAMARAELTRVASIPPAQRGGRPANPGVQAAPPLRLTSRTLAVLRAIARRPGLNNSQVAREAGIADPSQVSKLLARLRALGLIDCDDASQGRPVGKAWTLTATGCELVEETTGHRWRRVP
jgi:AcrR family transcriptional regulator